ncbi:lytic transglycosylase domain-containing protein [Bosea sp. NPDC055332]
MRSSAVPAVKTLIPLFAERPAHPAVPLDRRTAGARSEGQGRRFAGASREPLTAASTLAGWRCSGDRALFRSAIAVAICALGPLFICVSSGIANAQSTPIGRATAADPHASHIIDASRRFGIPERWIRAVMRKESAGDVGAVSSAGAIGLMQVMPETWAELRLRHGLGRSPYDPHDNILAGTAYLREMWDRYGDAAAMLAAYNAGPARYDEHRAKGRPLPAETRAYIALLAPVLRAERPSKIAFTVTQPLDWRDAAIFIMRDDGMFTANPTSPDRPPTNDRSSKSATPAALTTSQPAALFITRRGSGAAP